MSVKIFGETNVEDMDIIALLDRICHKTRRNNTTASNICPNTTILDSGAAKLSSKHYRSFKITLVKFTEEFSLEKSLHRQW